MTQRITIKQAKEYPWYLRLFFHWQEKRLGRRVIPMQIWGRQPILLRKFASFFKALERPSSPIPPLLRALITVKVSQINQCAFCVDFNAHRVLESGGQLEKLEALKDYTDSSALEPAEKVALAYAEAITRSDQEPSDALFQELKQYYSEDAIVELTALIAFQNLSSKFNSALDIPSQGFCQL